MADSTPKRKLYIDIVSDTVCPWCYVGSRRMEKALKKANVEAEIKWHPFYLNPPGIFPPEGVDIMEHLSQKYGPGFKRAQTYLDKAGLEVGIKFKHEGQRVSDTTDSHRLIAWANTKGKENELMHCLFRRHFEEGQFLGDLEGLADAAAEVGLDRAEALEYLKSDEGKLEVGGEVHEWANKFGRVTGVPYFIIRPEGSERRVAFGGAEDEEFWLEAIEKVHSLK